MKRKLRCLYSKDNFAEMLLKDRYPHLPTNQPVWLIREEELMTIISCSIKARFN